MSPKKTHGGARPGSGRKDGYEDGVRVTLLLPRKLWRFLDRFARSKGKKRNRLVVESLQKIGLN